MPKRGPIIPALRPRSKSKSKTVAATLTTVVMALSPGRSQAIDHVIPEFVSYAQYYFAMYGISQQAGETAEQLCRRVSGISNAYIKTFPGVVDLRNEPALYCTDGWWLAQVYPVHYCPKEPGIFLDAYPASRDPDSYGGVRYDVPICYRLVPRSELYKIVLTSDEGAAGSLATVEPGASVHLVARVYDHHSNAVPNIDVKLETKVEDTSGGHAHLPGRPKGDLETATGSGADKTVLSGTTGSNGFAFIFKAPIVAGDHKIVASCVGRTCKQEGANTVWVGVKGLERIPAVPPLLPYATYELLEQGGKPVGATDEHPSNHYLTPEAITKLWNLGFRYSMIEFPNNPKLHINDASLERGGVFDLNGTWKPKHHEHRRGTVVDIRANLRLGAIPEKDFSTFESIASILMIDAHLERQFDAETGQEIVANRHYHVRLMERKE